jgi:AcrR family transcriptional regulator
VPHKQPRRPTTRSAPAKRKTAAPHNVTPGSPTRIEILKCAAGAFRRLGFHGATVDEIAAALGMKKGNLYYYFRNKEDILFACHQYSLDRLLDVLETIEDSDQRPDEKLHELIVAFAQLILDDLHGTALFLDLQALTPPHLRQAIARRDKFDHGVRRVIQQGIDWGTFSPSADPKLLSFAILGAVNWIPRWYSKDGPSSSHEIAERFADYLISGLRSL